IVDSLRKVNGTARKNGWWQPADGYEWRNQIDPDTALVALADFGGCDGGLGLDGLVAPQVGHTHGNVDRRTLDREAHAETASGTDVGATLVRGVVVPQRHDEILATWWMHLKPYVDDLVRYHLLT